MRVVFIPLLVCLGCAANLSSKDKTAKVSFQQMAAGMRDAFNCGVVVEQYLHGPLKGKDDNYHQLRKENNCDYVESVLNTLPDEQH
jgi:putative salt-induced outer membrane protein YdiY